jgi:hypothetical protein
MRSTQVILAAPAERTPVAPGVSLILTRFDSKILTQIILKGISANVQEVLGSDNVTIESLRNLPTKRRKMCWDVYLHILELDDGPTGGYAGSSVAKGGVWSRIKSHRLNIQAGLTVSLHYSFVEKHGRCPGKFILLAIFPMDDPRLACIVRLTGRFMAMYLGTIAPPPRNPTPWHGPASMSFINTVRANIDDLPNFGGSPDTVSLNGCSPLKQSVYASRPFAPGPKCQIPGCTSRQPATNYPLSGNPLSGKICRPHWHDSRYSDPRWLERRPCYVCGTSRDPSSGSEKRWSVTPETSRCGPCHWVDQNMLYGGCVDCGSMTKLCS